MPCIDDRDYPTSYRDSYKESEEINKKLKKRNDELAAENCQFRALLCKFNDLSDITIYGDLLTEYQLATMHKALKDQKIHRTNDKKRVIKALKKKISDCQQRVATIKELGGIPSNELVDEIKEYEKQLAEVKKSNPQETELY